MDKDKDKDKGPYDRYDEEAKGLKVGPPPEPTDKPGKPKED